MPGEFLFTHYLALILGALFFALSVTGLVLRARFVAGAKPVSAVISNVAIVGRDTATVRFSGEDGTQHEARLLRPGRAIGPVGTQLLVLFNPARPDRVIRSTWRDTWGPPLTGVLVGLALVAFHLVRGGLF